MNIVLLGYMGCGKSSIGIDLAAKMNMEYIDLDNYIEKKENKKIPQIFKDKGEIYFRKKETEYLKEIIDSRTNTILSLGGGTPCFSGNMEYIKETELVKSIYLKTSLDELVKRLIVEKEKRPLIAHISSDTELKDFIRKHVFERSFYYNQAAYHISTDKKSIEEIVEEIDKTLF